MGNTTPPKKTHTILGTLNHAFKNANYYPLTANINRIKRGKEVIFQRGKP